MSNKIPRHTHTFVATPTFQNVELIAIVSQAMPTLLAQSSTLSILRGHLATLDTFVELGMELVGFEQDEAGVTARIAKRIDGDTQPTEELIRASWLVGTDGARGILLLRMAFMPAINTL